MNWISEWALPKIKTLFGAPREVPENLWHKCPACDQMIFHRGLERNLHVCTHCGHHMRVDSNERIRQLIDANTWKPINEDLRPLDPLQFRDRKAYSDRLREYQQKTGLYDAVQTGEGQLDGLPVALGVMDFRFLGGSMGSVVGENSPA